MTQASSVDSCALKENLLEMWVPAAGEHTTAELLTKNFVKSFRNKVPRVMQDIFEEFVAICFKTIFEGDFGNYFDTQPPFQLGNAILTGSLSDGLFLYTTQLPDMDFMLVLKNITFSQEDQEDGSLLLRDDTPFVHAFITSKETQHIWRDFLDDVDNKERKRRLSSRKLKQKLQQNYQKPGSMFFPTHGQEQLEEVTEGAAVTISKSQPVISFLYYLVDLKKTLLCQPITELFFLEIMKSMSQLEDIICNRILLSSDIVLSIFCEGWPSCAKEWITRKRFWPDLHSVEQIAHSGYHIVPKSSADGDFRLSFSCVETKLIETLMPLQHKVMRAFKAVVKYHENTWKPNLKDILSSYHLKTIAFWHFEKTSRKSWTEGALVHHLVTLHENLAEALRVQNLPMYFMPKVNLLQDAGDPEVTLDLMENISQLSRHFSAMSEALSNCNAVEQFIFTQFL